MAHSQEWQGDVLDAAAGEGGEHCDLDCLTYALTVLNVRLACLRSGLDCLMFLLDRNGKGACTTRRLENVGSTAFERMRAVVIGKFLSCSEVCPPWRQPRGKLMGSLVNSHTNTTRIGWHLWEIDLRLAPGLPPGWYNQEKLAIVPRIDGQHESPPCDSCLPGGFLGACPTRCSYRPGRETCWVQSTG